MAQLQQADEKVAVAEKDEKTAKIERLKGFSECESSARPSNAHSPSARSGLAKKAPRSRIGDAFEFDPFVDEGTGVRALRDLKENENFMKCARELFLAAMMMMFGVNVNAAFRVMSS